MKGFQALRTKMDYSSLYIIILFKLSLLIYLAFIVLLNLTTPTTAYFLDGNITHMTLRSADAVEEKDASENIETDKSNAVKGEKLDQNNLNEKSKPEIHTEEENAKDDTKKDNPSKESKPEVHSEEENAKDVTKKDNPSKETKSEVHTEEQNAKKEDAQEQEGLDRK